MLSPLSTPPDHQATLARLHALSRNHLLFFRLEVGRLLLQDYFGGDPAAYHSQDPDKTQSFVGFLESCGEQLKEIGLGETVLRSCILAQAAVAALPPGTVERLLFSHIVELARVHDGATRSLLAQATIENQWSSRQLRDAAQAARAGLWIDGDPAPGLQPVAPEEGEKAPQLGRVVSRMERSAEDLEGLSGQWRQLAGKKLTSGQKNRVKEALSRLKAQIAELEGQLDRPE
ncbi:MAG TPA: hypothetical protein PKW90_01975 [Myxococcota bacterium]|nr:hypothetical protein [Myxococcota bacterium]